MFIKRDKLKNIMILNTIITKLQRDKIRFDLLKEEEAKNSLFKKKINSEINFQF